MQTDLANFTDAAEFNMRFFAMLTGPFYPILHILKERSELNCLMQSNMVPVFHAWTQPFKISLSFANLTCTNL